MGMTIVEKILGAHSADSAAPRPDDIVDLAIDARVARDFGGANVVQSLERHRLPIADPRKTFFTFDCNPGGSDPLYAQNQHTCRLFGRQHGIGIYDIDRGIGTHIAIDEGLVGPGATLVSTDSHANILGAIGAFGQGMGDVDIAHAFAHGRVWFKVPPTVRLELVGAPPAGTTAKDVGLLLLQRFGAAGLLGAAAELYGPFIDALGLAGRITLASLATEMGAILLLIPPNEAVLAACGEACGEPVRPTLADDDARYAQRITIDLGGLEPLVSRPGHPEDVVTAQSVAGTKIDSAFVGSCTNGRFEDLARVARILEGRRVAPGVVLKIVPATDRIWQRCLSEGLLEVFKRAGALIGNAGCAGCAAGQIGQNGPGEITVSTGNRNFAGKQGKGSVYLASPEVVAASAVAGGIALPAAIPAEPARFAAAPPARATEPRKSGDGKTTRPTTLRGRLWVVRRDHIDTDMIFHNRHLAVTELAEMGRYTFGNLAGWEDFAKRAERGDIVVAGQNFGAGSSRQQAVDCFKSLGIALLIAESFGAIYERNAINAGFPILVAPLAQAAVSNGMAVEVDLTTGRITTEAGTIRGRGLAPVQLEIYQRGGLLE